MLTIASLRLASLRSMRTRGGERGTRKSERRKVEKGGGGVEKAMERGEGTPAVKNPFV